MNLKHILILLFFTTFFACNSDKSKISDFSNSYKTIGNKLFYVKKTTSGTQEIQINTNPARFKIISNSINNIWAKDCLNVYFKEKIIIGANPKTFKILSSGYAVDKKNAFFEEKILENADTHSFVVMSDLYAKDKNTIWNKNNIVKGIRDINSFKLIDKNFAADSGTIYFSKNNKFIPIKHADTKSFKEITKFNDILDYNPIKYYTDKNNIYIINSEKEKIYLVKNVNTNDFKVLTGYFIKIENIIYYKNKILNNCDTISFKILDSNYAKDEGNVWYKGKIIPQAIAKSFILSENNKYDTKDSLNYYLKGKIVNTGKESN